MGFSIAISAPAIEDVDDFFLVAGIEATQIPDPHNETRLSGAPGNKHYLVWRNWRKTSGKGDPEYANMSQGVGFLQLDINETVMVAQVRRFEGGKMVWGITGDDSGLSIEGDCPLTKAQIVPEYTAYLRSLNLEDSAGDVENDGFGLAAEAFVMLTGFRYDSLHELPFVELSGEMPRRKPKWKFW